MLFTGISSNRRINLGGSSNSPMDRSAFIEKQRRDREDRDLNRRRDEAARRVQRVFRGAMTRGGVNWRLAALLVKRVDDLRIAVRQCTGPDLAAGVLTRALVDTYGDKNVLSILTLLNPARSHIELDVLTDIAEWVIAVRSRHSASSTSIVRLVALVGHLLGHKSHARRQINALINTQLRHPALLTSNKVDLITLFSLLDTDTSGLILSWGSTLGDASIVPRCVLSLLQSTDASAIELPAALSPLQARPPDAWRLDFGLVSVNLLRLIVRGLLNGKDVVTLCQWLGVLYPHLSVSTKRTLQSVLVDSYVVNNHRLADLQLVLDLVTFSTLPEETLFLIATHSNLIQLIADNLITGLSANPPTASPQRLTAFTALFSKVVTVVSTSAGGSIITPDAVQTLFPLLNRFAFTSIVRTVDIDPAVFQVIKSVYDKKHVFPKLVPDNVWTISQSIEYIPANVNSFELIDRVRAADADEEVQSVHVSEHHRTVFESLIENLPHAIPFEHRVRIFASALAEDQRRQAEQSWSFRSAWADRVKRVRRGYLLEDGLGVVDQSDNIKDVLRIEFVSTVGEVESGIDGGGLFKEFMHLWTVAVMNPDLGLFRQLGNGRLTPAPDAYLAHPDAERLFRAAGRAVGKAVYEMVLLETHLGESFLNRVLGRPFAMEQLAELDESLFKNMKFVNESNSVEDLSLTFSVSSGGEIGPRKEVELIPGGLEVPVTSANKLRYTLLASWYHLSRQLDRPAAAFAAGLSDVIPLSWLRMFSPREINLLISGEQREGFDVDDLQRNAVYGGGYAASSPTIALLWEVVSEFSGKDQSAFLAFVTSSQRPPLLGFRVLHPKFAINRVPERDRLPTSSTCANLLKLPDYQDKALLREKLLASIHSHSGFDLS